MRSRIWWLALLLAALPLSDAFAQVKTCDQFRASVTTGTMGVTERVPAVVGKTIYICGWMIVPTSGGSGLDFELSAGTGVNCATNKTIIIPRMTVPVNGIVNRGGGASGEFAPLGYAMCLQTWGNKSVTSIFYWTQS
jgi:hypothetical protein